MSPPAHQADYLQSQRVMAWTRWAITLILLALLALLARVAQLKVSPDAQLAASAGGGTSTRSEFARRGDVVDRRGRVIATSSVGHRLFVDPVMVKDMTTIALDLGEAIGMDPMTIDRSLAARPESRYVVINPLLEDWQVDAVNRARLAGVALEPRLVRHYPHGDLAASLIGMVGFEHSGLGGIEHTLEENLAPTHGTLTYLRDARGRPLWIQPAGYQPGEDGESVRLTIDLVIQESAQRRLDEAVKQFQAGGGRAVVLDCRSGEILAMCDTLNPRKGWSEFTTDSLRKKFPALGRNRCVSDPYEPGSTFKPFIWSVATELGKARLDEWLPTPGPENAPYHTSRGRAIRDVKYHGPMTWHTVLVKSINAGMAIVAERLTQKQMQDAVARFGFGASTNCGAPGETKGIVTTPRNWTHYTQTSVAMGHEIGVTPVQMARAFSVFCNDGAMPALTLIAPMTPPSEQYGFVHRVLTPEIARTTKDAMKDVMLEGTGRAAQSEKYQLFGKSGTAQLPRKGGKGYWEDRYVASFIAGAPFDDPRIVVLVVLDDPDKRKGHFGGAIAGPVVRDIIDQTLEYLGVEAELTPEDGVHIATAQ